MKRIYAILLAAMMLLCSCGKTPETSSVDNTSSATVSEETSSVKDTSSKKGNSSKNTSSWVLDVAAFVREIDGEKYFDVSAAAAASPRRPDDSEFFPEPDGFVGYYIEKGVYMVDAETMYRVIECPFKGDGSIKWTGFKANNWMNNPDPFDGVLPIAKIKDPLYLQLCLPHEDTISDTAGNGNNNFEVLPKVGGSLTTLCAIYLKKGKADNLPDDAVVTLCFGEMRLAVRKDDGKGWFLAMNSTTEPDNIHHGPASLGNIYPIPWQLENDANPVSNYNVGRDTNVKWVDDHYEVTVTGADLKGKKFTDSRVTWAVFHTWSTLYHFDDKNSIEGIATSYKVWVKEPEWSGFLVGDTGADCRQNGEPCHQTFASRYFSITDQSKTVYGHNVGPKRYDEIMDSEKVQELLDLK